MSNNPNASGFLIAMAAAGLIVIAAGLVMHTIHG
jgi:hypothetical protein